MMKVWISVPAAEKSSCGDLTDVVLENRLLLETTESEWTY